MPEQRFVSTYIKDFRCARGIQRDIDRLLLRNAVWDILYILFFLFLLLLGSWNKYILFFVIFPVAYGLLQLYVTKTTHKQEVMLSGDQNPKIEIIISENGIENCNTTIDSQTKIPFEHVRRICESKRWIMLQLDHSIFIAVDKNSLSGGTVEELKNFLKEHCKSLRRKRIVTSSGKLIYRVLAAVFLVLYLSEQLLFGIISSLQRDFMESMIAQCDGPEQTAITLTAAEAAEELEQLGFDPIAEDIVEKVQKEVDAGRNDGDTDLIATEALLSHIGWGNYTYDEIEGYCWEALTNDVYCINSNDGVYDSAAREDQSIYLNIVKGVSLLCGDTLPITKIQLEEKSDWYTAGFHSGKVSFILNGEAYALEGLTKEPYVDVQFIKELIALINAVDGEKKLYIGANSSYEDLLLFYNDADWAAEFEQATGMKLCTSFE